MAITAQATEELFDAIEEFLEYHNCEPGVKVRYCLFGGSVFSAKPDRSTLTVQARETVQMPVDCKSCVFACSQPVYPKL
jgi:hypothetical protein